MSAVLALDVGSVRIGVAICEGSNLPAVPLITVIRTKLQEDLVEIIRLAGERHVGTIVVGYPIRLDGTLGQAAKHMDSFIRALRDRFHGEVVRQDERLTTAAAAKKLRDLKLSGSKRRARVDQLAAVEILNSYLSARSRA
jgi:putative holliday junction resolvase